MGGREEREGGGEGGRGGGGEAPRRVEVNLAPPLWSVCRCYLVSVVARALPTAPNREVLQEDVAIEPSSSGKIPIFDDVWRVCIFL